MKTLIALSALAFCITLPDLTQSQNTVSIRLGPLTGQDCNVASYIPDTPLPQYPDIVAAAWTYGGEFNLWRPLFRFNLSEIPSGAHVTNARLSLFGNPSPASALHSGANKSYIRKVTSPWNQQSVTWETQPDFSTVNQVLLPESTSPTQDYTDIDVTAMISDMVNNPSENYGFVIMNRFENIYRSMNFASSDCFDVTKRPLLVITYNTVGIENVSSEIPEKLGLAQNYPNPFNPVTSIAFDLPVSGFTTVKIFDELGREVSTLASEQMRAGKYKVSWNGSDRSSGAYFVRLTSGNKALTKKIILLK